MIRCLRVILLLRKRSLSVRWLSIYIFVGENDEKVGMLDATDGVAFVVAYVCCCSEVVGGLLLDCDDYIYVIALGEIAW